MRSQSSQILSKLMEMLPGDMEEPGDIDTTLQRIVQTARDVFSADLCTVTPINPITKRFLGLTTIDGELRREQEVEQLQPRPDGITQEVLNQGPLWIEDLAAHREYESDFTRVEGIQSFAALPLSTIRLKKPLAALYISYRRPRRFSEDDKRFLQLFAEYASQVLQNTRLLRRYRQVAHIGEEINRKFDAVGNLFQRLQENVAGILDISHFFMLAVYQPESETLDWHMIDEGSYKFLGGNAFEGAWRWIIEHPRPHLIRHLTKESERLPKELLDLLLLAAEKPESAIFVPLALPNKPLGVLTVQQLHPQAYDGEDLHILELLGNQVALALNNLDLFHRLTRANKTLIKLNSTGQFLIQQLESEQALQNLTDRIREATDADIVALYPYVQARKLFQYPCRLSGNLLRPDFPQPRYSRLDDIASLTIRQAAPVFARDSSMLYKDLEGAVNKRRGNFEQREQVCSTVAAPLRVGDEAVGVLFINFRQTQRFDSPQRQLIEGLAHYVAIAIKNSREFDALTRRHGRELELLRNIDHAISKTLDLPQVLQTILKMATEYILAEDASILLYNPRTNALEAKAAIGRHAGYRERQVIPLDRGTGITLHVYKQKTPARVNNVRADPDWQDKYFSVAEVGGLPDDILSELDVPLFDGDEAVGVINFESPREAAFSQADQDFLVTLSDRAVLAIKNAQNYERQKRLAEERQALIEISKQITSQLDPNRIFELILDKALEVTHCKAGNLMVYDAREQDLWMAADRGVEQDKKGSHQNLEQGIVGWVARNRKLLNVDVSKPPWDEVYVRFIPDTRSELAVPILQEDKLRGQDDKLRGVLNIESPAPNYFGEHDEGLLNALSGMAVIALQNAEQFKTIEKSEAELRALRDVDERILSQLDDPDLVVRAILESALKLFDADIAELRLHEDGKVNTIYFARASNGEQPPWIEQVDAKDLSPSEIERDALGRVEEMRKSHKSQSVQQGEVPFADNTDIYSRMVRPLVSKSELIGMLTLERLRRHPFESDDKATLDRLIAQAIIGIDNARNYARAEKELQRFKLLHRAGSELSQITDLGQLDQAYDLVIQKADVHNVSQVVIRRCDEEAQELVLVRVERPRSSPPFNRMKLDEGVNGQVARERRTIVVNNIDKPPRDVLNAKLSDPGTHSLVVAPIQFEDRYYGNLALSHEEVNYFRDADVELIEGLAKQLAITIHGLESVQAQREAEQRAREAELMSSIGQSTLELSHRLANDLGLIKSYVNNVRRELSALNIPAAPVESNLSKIVLDVHGVLDLNKRLKQGLATLQEDGIEPNRKDVIPVEELLRESVKAYPDLPSSIQVCFEIEDSVALVRAVPGQIKDALRNLFVNAVEAMPEGGTITLRGRNSGDYAEIDVEDTGIGIAPERKSRIFDLFYSTKGGLGFGLWSARRNALANGGDLKVKSSPGQGTTFTLSLRRGMINIGGEP